MNESGGSIRGANPHPIWLHVELLLVITIWAGTFVSTKMVLEQITPVLSALYRYLIASLLLLILDAKNGQRIKPADYPTLLLLSLTGVTFYYLLQHIGIKYTTALDAAILISLSPVFIGLISWLYLQQPVKALTAMGLVIALLGCILVITRGKTVGWNPDSLQGNLLMLLTAVSWAIYSVGGKRMVQIYHPQTLIKYTTIIGTACLIPFAIPEISRCGLQSLNTQGWLNMVYLGGAASVYGYLAWYRALTRLPAVTVGSYLYFRPLLTGILAAIILHESIGLVAVLGGILVIVGTYLTTR